MADFSAGQAYLAIVPSLAGFGDKVREQLAKEDLSVSAQVKPDVDTSKAASAGEEYGSAFGDAARARISAALKDLPNVKIDADSSDADRKIDEIRTRLEELRDKRIGVDISGADALAELKAISTELDDVGRKHPDIDVRVNTAAAQAELAALDAEIQKLDGKRASFDVNDNGSAQRTIGDILNLQSVAVSLGPAIIPVAAAIAAALGAIGIGAIAGIAALGTLKLGFSGVGTAVSALTDTQTQQGKNATQQAAQQISAANSVASAQDGVRNAVRGVEDAQRSAAIANTSAAEQVANAQRGVQDAYIQAGISIQNALDAEARAEQALANAQQQEQLAQESLTAARQAAQRQIESLTLSVADGALAERQAQLNIQQAKQNLDKTLANPAAPQLQREQAQLTYDQAVQQLTDVQARNRDLQQDQQAAVKAGVDGSQQVQAAQRGVASATQATADAQQALVQAAANVAEARRAGAEKITTAEQSLSDAQAKQAETARAGAESVAKAQEQVVTAQRALQGALAQQAAQAASTTSSVNKLQEAMSKLSPAGQEFARFLAGLKPQLDQLKATAQEGLLPGVEAGIKAMLPLMPQFNTLIGSVATAMGDMARRTGEALNSPFWRQFFDFVNSEAGPSLRIFGSVIGNLATGFAGLLQAFKPVWDQMGAGLLSLTQRFAAFGQTAGQNTGFQQFLNYVQQTGPVVVHTIGDLVVMFGNIGRALAPVGGIVLGLVDGFARLVNALPPGWLQVIVIGLWSGYEAWKAWQIIQLVAGWITAFKEAQILATAATYAQSVASGIATAAQWAWNIAMDANPIGIVILAIGALIAIVILVANNFSFFKNIVLACWNGIGGIVFWAWNTVLRPFFDWVGGALTGAGNLFMWLWHGAIQIAVDGITATFNGLMTIVHAIVDSFNWAIGTIAVVWNRLMDIAKIPVNFVIGTVYNHGIVPVWDGIAGLFGLPQLQPAPLLAEGGVLPGYAPGRDTIPAVLSAGEGVLVPEAVRGLGADFVHSANSYFSGGRANSRGVTRFAGGGIVGNIASIITDPIGSVKSLFAGVVGTAANIPGAGLLRQALVNIPTKVIDAVIAKAKAFIASIGSSFSAAFTGSADLAGWIAAALAITNTPQTWAGPLSVLIGRESGGNPNAINLTDSNAAAGHPSQGLMQTIPSTFTAYHQAGTSWNILDPVANISAGINYVKGRYGSIFNVQQANPNLPPKGYDSGGWLPPGLTLAYNGTGQAERVLTSSQFSGLAGAASGGGRPPVTVNVYPRADHSEADIADMVSRRLAFTMRVAT